MTKILSAEKIRELDAYTIANEPIASIDLMERACRAFVLWFTERVDATKRIGVVCGTGNNGGDGLGIARMLVDWGYKVEVWIVRGNGSESEDFRKNFSRLGDGIKTYEITTDSDRGLFKHVDVLIDAIFGSGLSRPVTGIYEQVIGCVNASGAKIIAVDIPSGLMADKPSSGAIVKADYTVSFQLPRLAFFLPESHQFTGEWVVVDIGLSREFVKQTDSDYLSLTKKFISKLIRRRSRFDHKGTFGHALLVAGSYGKVGAAVLASRAALRAGAGLVSVHAPKCANLILQTAVPEAMFQSDKDENIFTGVENVEKYSVVGIGPGLGQDKSSGAGLRHLLNSFRKAVVVDADGLNLMSNDPSLLQLLPAESILTPHPKEFQRLVGSWSNDFERLDKQREFASRFNVVVIVKGAFTTIATPQGKIYFNTTGNPGMATGGTGDVLTGVLTGLVSQGYDTIHAALLGVYLHGLAGDLAAVDKASVGLVASDLVDYLPVAYRNLT